jgi:phospholipase/carboxylesterase
MPETDSLPLYHIASRPRQEPPAGQRPPLLLLLHGIGSHEQDLFGLVPYLDPRFYVLSLRAPLTMFPGSYAWFELNIDGRGPRIRPEQAEESRQALISFIESAPAAYQADPEQLYLMGFSQGAMMSLAVTVTRPELLAGVVAMSGRTMPELFDSTTALGGHLAPEEALLDFPLFITHGRQDPVLPIQFGRESRDRFATLPVDLTYKEYDMAHSVSDESLRDVIAWLAERLEQDVKRET